MLLRQCKHCVKSWVRVVLLLLLLLFHLDSVLHCQISSEIIPWLLRHFLIDLSLLYEPLIDFYFPYFSQVFFKTFWPWSLPYRSDSCAFYFLDFCLFELSSLIFASLVN